MRRIKEEEMKHPLYAVIIIMLLTTLACSVNITIPTMQLGPTKTFTVNEAISSGTSQTNISMTMGAGTLKLAGGASGLVEGTIKYNVPGWDPKITTLGNQVTITQGETTNITGIPSSNLVNDWELKLSDTEAMNLMIAAGAYKGNMDFSGMHLLSLSIMDGASQNKAVFNTPNPEKMDTFTYRTGASQVELDGLANANFVNMDFEGGAGQYTFDFSGALKQDTSVTIKTGVSSITIIVPIAMSITFVNSGNASNITTTGTWTVNGETYTTDGSGFMLTINSQIAVGTVKLVRK
jgi:hypothetical protein